MAEQEGRGEKVPFWQVVLDDVFLLLALGLTIPLILYIVWGVVDVAGVPLFGR